MRIELEKHNGKRLKFTGTFSRFGTKTFGLHESATILLLNIHNQNKTITTDHLWFNKTNRFAELNLKEGDIVEFEARITPYIKGYFHDELDFKLNYPTKIKKAS